LSKQTHIPQKVIVGVDDSEGSIRAVDFAIALSEKLGSSIVFVHAVTLGDTGRKLLEECQSKAAQKNIPSKSFLEVGEPAQIILAKTDEESCDCIVVGKEGQPKIQGNLLLSTTAQKLITLSKVPVICI
jgi:nucleotide-binding universal stress UspA family protein